MRTLVILLGLLALLDVSSSRKKVDKVEDVDSGRLEELVDTGSTVAVLFYPKSCKNCPKILQELEKISESDSTGILFVKNGERTLPEKYGITDFPSLTFFKNKESIIYFDDLLDGDKVRSWLSSVGSGAAAQASTEVDAATLQRLIDDTEYVAVLFTNNKSEECLKVVQKLESIDEETIKTKIAFVKISDEVLAIEFGLESLPALLYYRNKIPLLYTGNLHDRRVVLRWLERHKDLEADLVEDKYTSALPAMIENNPFIAVLFHDETNQESVIDMETIDDEASKHGIPFVKIADLDSSQAYGIMDLPALVYFEKNVPNVYQGNLTNQQEILDWLIHQKENDEIEDVTNKVLVQMIKSSTYLTVLFYDSESNSSESVLKALESIDAKCDENNIPFVKIDDSQLESLFGIKNPPALLFYKKQVPRIYEGNVLSEVDVLWNWIEKQILSEEIDDATTSILNQMIKNTDFLCTLFYNKNDEVSKKTIKVIESVKNEADKKSIPIVKISDTELAKFYGIEEDLPILIYFENEIPTLFRGDIMNSNEITKWLLNQVSKDEINEISDKILDVMIKKRENVAVFLYDSSVDGRILNQMEKINTQVFKRGVLFLKTSDLTSPEKYGIEYLPAIVFFNKMIPSVFTGNIADEKEVVDWIIGQLTKVEIKDITEKMLLDLVENSPAVAAIFYDSAASSSSLVLKEIEKIDDEIKDYDVPFVKTSDESLAKYFGVNDELPALVYFENKIPSMYKGDLLNSSAVLEWLIKLNKEDSIEDVTEEILLNLVRDEGYVLTFFAPPNCAACDAMLPALEMIDKEANKLGILFVTTRDIAVATTRGNVTDFPAIILFRNEFPVLYTGDLMLNTSIIEWLCSKETLENPYGIEELNKRMFENLLNVSPNVAALFYRKKDCKECLEVIQNLESIDKEAKENYIDFVKISDAKLADSYGITEFPSLMFFRKHTSFPYAGDLTKPAEILLWLIDNRDRPDSFIEDVDRRELEILIEEHTVAVFFYDENCTLCDTILMNLENIDDDSDRYGVQILKTDDTAFATELGISSIPSFVYFENMIPSIYDGDIMNENDLLTWLVQQKTEDTIENINRDMLFRMIEEQEYLAIYFYKENDKESKDILKHLEQIDDDCSDYEVQLLKMSDNLMAKKFRVRHPPGLVFFRHGNPITYPGDLTDEEEVLDFLTSPDNMESSDAIEKVNRRMLERVLTRSDYLAVFFYRKTHCRKCAKALEELENIDDDGAAAEGVHFVKIEDDKLARSFGVFNMPALVFFRFGDVDDPVVYAGDLKNGSDILDWLITQKDPSSDMIEEMEGDELEYLIETAEYLAVLFYDPDEEDCPQCKETLSDLENIDDDTDRHKIMFVKTSDDSIAADYGITKFPALIYYENNVPSIYEGDISAEEEVLQWLIHSKSEDTIETVNRDMCDKLIEETSYLVVLFYKHQNKFSEDVLEHLENIDGITDDNGIQMVKTQDSSISRRYGVKQFPALVFFRNQRPLVYQGDLRNEEEVLTWIMSDTTLQLPDNIEEINGKMLEKLIERHLLLAVYFYEKECEECMEILNVLEEIDEEADLFAVGFVKVSDTNAAVKYGVHSVPTLAYFRKTVPVFFEGSLNDGERVLDWLTSQDMIELKNEIELVSRKMLDKLLQENDFIAIIFYDDDCPLCDEALRSLEEIDDDIDELDILFVKIKDARYARKYGVKNLPSLTYFRKRFPTVYHGNLTNTDEVFNWLKKNRYRSRELNLFMFAIIAMGVVFIQYTFFLKFCFKPMVEKQS